MQTALSSHFDMTQRLVPNQNWIVFVLSFEDYLLALAPRSVNDFHQIIISDHYSARSSAPSPSFLAPSQHHRHLDPCRHYHSQPEV